MKKMILIMAIAIVTGSLCSANAYNGKNVNAKAVSVNWRHAPWMYDNIMCCECYDGFADGALVLYTIQNSIVTGADTIYPRSSGLAHYPAFNLSGNTIAFYRESVAPVANARKGCQAANGGKNTVSIINVGTEVVTNLCDIPSPPNSQRAEMVPLDWPAGDWIYYERTHDSADVWEGWSSSIDIWRVNAVTKVNEKVCNFSNNGRENICTYFRRFSLSIDATRMAAQLMGKYMCTVTPDIGGNAVWGFPPSACSFANGRLNYADGCNISISPSGGYMGSYLGGQHADIFINTVDGKNGTGSSVAKVNIHSQLESWAGQTIGNGAELIRWAVNSDKWVMQEIGFNPDGHAGTLCEGSNQVVCNWTDQVAINISKNRNLAVGADTMKFNNCAGDFWVDDPANNPQKNKYEDLQGVWHAAPGTSAVESRLTGASRNASPAIMGGSRIRVHVSSDGPWDIAISAADGRIMRMQRGAGADAQIATAGLSAGVYMMKISAQSGIILQRFVVR